MNPDPQDTPPPGGRQGLPFPPIIRCPEGVLRSWIVAGGAQGQALPQRRIPPKRGSLAGYIPFPSLNRNIWHESSLERDLLLALRPFDGLVGVLEQPLRLHCPDLGYGKGPYSPDFLLWIRLKTEPVFRPVLVEVKFEEDLRENWSTIRPKLMAARRFARRQGWRFLVMTPRHLRVPLPLPPLLSGHRARPYKLKDPMTVLTRLFGTELTRGPK